MRFLHILTTTACVCIGLVAVYAFLPEKSFAQNDGRYGANHQIEAVINEDSSVSFTHKIELINNSRDTINSYSLSVPFSGLESIVGERDRGRAGIKLRPSNKLFLDLRPNPLHPGKRTNLVYKYTVPSAIENENGLLSFFMPQLTAFERINNFSFKLEYPQTFPPMSYAGNKDAQLEERTIIVNELQPIKIMWGQQWGINIYDDTVSIVRDQSNKNQLVNVIPNLPNQNVTYEGLNNAKLFVQENGNVWASVSESFSYTASVDLQSDSVSALDFVGYDYFRFNLPEELADVESGLEGMEKIYDYLLEKGHISTDNLETIGRLQELENRVGLLTQNKFTSLEFTAVLAGFLNSADIPHRLKYGYFYGATWPEFNEQLPHVWLEALVDDQVVVLDPYLEKMTGLNFFNVQGVGRVTFGIWDPAKQTDTLLGLAGPGLKLRPSSVVEESVLGAETASPEAKRWDITVAVPNSVSTLSPYTAQIVINNFTNQILPLQELWWDNQEITGQFLQLEGQFTRAIAPNSSLELTVDGLYFPQLFKDGYHNHSFSLVPADSNFDKLTADYEILYLINFNALLSLLLLILLLMSGLGYFWWRWEKKQKLVEQLSVDLGAGRAH